MEATELRIGNYLEINGSFRKLSESLFISRLQSKKGFADIKPIPLTEEIVLRLGFERNCLISCRFGLERCSISFLSNGKIMFSEYYWEAAQKLEYVHQLQNLYFALNGKELTLKDK